MLFTTYSLVYNIHRRPISKSNFYNKSEVVTGTITLSVDHRIKWCVPINLVSLSYYEITILELMADQENGLLTVVCKWSLGVESCKVWWRILYFGDSTLTEFRYWYTILVTEADNCLHQIGRGYTFQHNNIQSACQWHLSNRKTLMYCLDRQNHWSLLPSGKLGRIEMLRLT
jgi:hypothetical protein